jgi:hypothetical protein
MSGMPAAPVPSSSASITAVVTPSSTVATLAPAGGAGVIDTSMISIIDYLRTNPVENADVYALLDRTDRARLSQLLSDVDAVDASKFDKTVHVGKTAKQFESEKSGKKGKLFEEITKTFLSGVACFDVHPNVVTSTNQLDVLVTLGPWAYAVPIFHQWGTHFVCECKFEDRGIAVEWLQKLESLLGTHGAKVGLLISKKPASKGTRGNIPHKLQLFAMKGVYIICISRQDLDKIAGGAALIPMIVERYIAVQMGVASIMAPSI